MFFVVKKHTDTLLEQKKTKPQETLEFKLNKQMETFSFSTPMKLSQERKQLLAVTIFEATNSVTKITDVNNSFSITTPERWIPEGGAEPINKLKQLLELRSQNNNIELLVEEVLKRGTPIEIRNSGYNSAGFDLFRGEILAQLRRVKHKDLEDKVCRMELTYDEIVVILEVKWIAGSISGYTLAPEINGTSDHNLVLKSSLPNEVKVNIRIDDTRPRSNLTTDKRKKFTTKSFSYTILGFTQSHSGLLNDLPHGIIQKTPGSYKSEKPINITGIDKIHLKCDCIDSSIVDVIRESILFNFDHDRPRDIKFEKPAESD